MLKRASETLQRWIAPLYTAMICAITFICVFLSHVAHGRARSYLPWPVLLVCGAVFFAGLFCVCSRYCRTPLKTRSLLLGAFCLLILQIVSVYQYFFYTDWDVPWLLDLAKAVAHGEDRARFLEYFSLYPNNLLLTWCFAAVERIVHALGLHEWEYFSLLCVQCLLCTVTGVLLYRILEKLFRDPRLSAFGFGLYFLLVGLSPWVSIPYSDAVGLLFPTLILYLYLYRDRAKRRWLSWLAIGFLSWIGYKIKPQVLILLIAIGTIRLLALLRSEKPLRSARHLAAAAAGVLCASLLAGLAVASMDLQLDREREIGFQHFFMMGLNPDAYGVWAGEDVDFSASFDTVAERNRADMERALSRIQEMGPVGLMKQAVRKTLTNYHDGTFCWSGEGDFFREVLPEKNPTLSRFFRSIYYTRSEAETGVNYAAWFNFEQMIWATILVCGAFAACGKQSGDRDVIMLSIIGLTLFELLFEARARYLYLYAPFYVLLAVYGVNELHSRLKQR